MESTRHAVIRSQQRGIPPLMIDRLREFGARQPAGHGAQKVCFDKGARCRLRAYAGAMASLLEQHLAAYAVVSNHGEVITVAHRTERINRQ